MTVTVTTRGARQLAVRFDQFPMELHEKLKKRVGEIIDVLYGDVSASALDSFAHPTGRLQSEIAKRIYGDNPERVAGTVSVYAGGNSNEYAKAATLEYGSDKPRKVASESGVMTRLNGSKRRIRAKLSTPAVIRAYRYLRDPFDDLQPEMVAALIEVISEAIAETDIGVAA